MGVNGKLYGKEGRLMKYFLTKNDAVLMEWRSALEGVSDFCILVWFFALLPNNLWMYFFWMLTARRTGTQANRKLSWSRFSLHQSRRNDVHCQRKWFIFIYYLSRSLRVVDGNGVRFQARSARGMNPVNITDEGPLVRDGVLSLVFIPGFIAMWSNLSAASSLIARDGLLVWESHLR